MVLCNLLEICALGSFSSGHEKGSLWKIAQGGCGEDSNLWMFPGCSAGPGTPCVPCELDEEPYSFCSVPPAPITDEVDIVPVGKGKTFEGSISIFMEQAKRVNLKLRGNKQ